MGWPTGNLSDGGDLLRRLTGDRSIRSVVGGVEAFVGFVTLVVVVFGGVGMLAGAVLFNSWAYHYPRVDRRPLEGLTAAWVVATLLAARSVAFFLQALESATVPVPLAVARRWLGTPAFARPVVAAWWLAMSGVVLAAAHFTAMHFESFRPAWYERVIAQVVPALFFYGSAFAVNTNVLIATAALTGHDGTVRRVWRMRLILDLLGLALFLHARTPASA